MTSAHKTIKGLAACVHALVICWEWASSLELNWAICSICFFFPLSQQVVHSPWNAKYDIYKTEHFVTQKSLKTYFVKDNISEKSSICINLVLLGLQQLCKVHKILFCNKFVFHKLLLYVCFFSYFFKTIDFCVAIYCCLFIWFPKYSLSCLKIEFCTWRLNRLFCFNQHCTGAYSNQHLDISR